MMTYNDEHAAVIQAEPLSEHFFAGERISVSIDLSVTSVCIFDPVLRLSLRTADGATQLIASHSHQSSLCFPWLPLGVYGFIVNFNVPQTEGFYTLDFSWGDHPQGSRADVSLPLSVVGTGHAIEEDVCWKMHPETQMRVAKLSWQQGLENWFHRHFCHAANVIGELFLQKTEKLRGRILDVGAGEGITDLGLILRYQPELFVSMDIVDYLNKLPKVAQANDLPLQALPDQLKFVQQSCENIPYDDEYFDVIISWGSVEHIVGGYQKVLDEVWRTLKPGGIFFVNPGLYYSAYGSHLGEFSDDPHLHLKISEDALKEVVLHGKPDIMDRSGFDVSNEDYWRFYKELNKIKVVEFEQNLKNYGYRILRAALRVSDIVQFTPELQSHSILDLATEDAFFVLEKP
ncbi:MAG: class I SAM-dependent methyltransferase [Mariprofundaceae bacterium]